MNNWLMIIGMACITFSVRYLFFAKSLPIRISSPFQKLLKFSAPAVLTAMWVPIVLMPEGEFVSSFSNPYLLAGILACVLSLLRLNTLMIVGISMASFLLLNNSIQTF